MNEINFIFGSYKNGNKFNKKVKDICNENYKTLLKILKRTPPSPQKHTKWEGIPCSWTRKIHIVKMFISCKAICRLNVI
jgi:hypothetical protein